jgi:hypothetical protein
MGVIPQFQIVRIPVFNTLIQAFHSIYRFAVEIPGINEKFKGPLKTWIICLTTPSI